MMQKVGQVILSQELQRHRRIVADPALRLETIRRQVVAKYGAWTKLTKFMAKLGGLLKGKPFPYGDRGVIITF